MSTLKVNTIQDASGNNPSTAAQLQQGRAKAWANFDATFGTSPLTEGNGGIRGAFNISSITDNGTGDFTLTFSTAMANVNYAVTCTTSATHNATTAIYGIESDHSTAYSTASIRIQGVRTAQNTSVDRSCVNVVVHGD